MKRERACPNCVSPIEQHEHGDLVTSTCTSCDWQEECMVARRFPEMRRSGSVFVRVHATEKVSGRALAALRSVSVEVSQIPLDQLQDRLTSDVGIALGSHAEYRAKEIQHILKQHGLLVEWVASNNEV